MSDDEWYKNYIDAKICNMHRGDGARRKYIYADIRSASDQLLVSADLDYCVERMTLVTELLKEEK